MIPAITHSFILVTLSTVAGATRGPWDFTVGEGLIPSSGEQPSFAALDSAAVGDRAERRRRRDRHRLHHDLRRRVAVLEVDGLDDDRADDAPLTGQDRQDDPP